MNNREAISEALVKACKYIQDHEDTANYSKQTAGKVLYSELLALVAMLGSGAKSTDPAPSRAGAHAAIRDMIKDWFDISLSSAAQDASDILDKLAEFGYAAPTDQEGEAQARPMKLTASVGGRASIGFEIAFDLDGETVLQMDGDKRETLEEIAYRINHFNAEDRPNPQEGQP